MRDEPFWFVSAHYRVEVDVFARLILFTVITFVPGVALAQAQAQAQAEAQSQTAAQAEWDIAAVSGLFAGYSPRTTGIGYQEEWFESAQGGVIAGRYLTPHLKLELEGTATTSGTQFRERQINVPDYPYPYPVGAEVSTSVRSVGAAVTWQFRDNEWVHPFVQAGISADFDRVSVRTWEQVLYSSRSGTPPVRVVEPRVEGPTTTRTLRPMVGGGAKLYVTPRAFVRTDARWTRDRTRHHVAARIGFGLDF